jgi:hypothetical protein
LFATQSFAANKDYGNGGGLRAYTETSMTHLKNGSNTAIRVLKKLGDAHVNLVVEPFQPTKKISVAEFATMLEEIDLRPTENKNGDYANSKFPKELGYELQADGTYKLIAYEPFFKKYDFSPSTDKKENEKVSAEVAQKLLHEALHTVGVGAHPNGDNDDQASKAATLILGVANMWSPYFCGGTPRDASA